MDGKDNIKKKGSGLVFCLNKKTTEGYDLSNHLKDLFEGDRNNNQKAKNKTQKTRPDPIHFENAY